MIMISDTFNDPKYSKYPARRDVMIHPSMTETNSVVEGKMDDHMYEGARAEKMRISAAMDICNQMAD
jgi:hypothetical protein